MASASTTCDAAKVGRIIGPQGTTIQRLQAETGARISVATPRDALRATITITAGSEAEVTAALHAVEALVNPPSARVLCDPAIIAQLIGPAGSTIKRLQAETGARIDVDSQHTPCEVTISGASPAIVEAARRAVEAIVSPTSLHICCDSSSVGQVIGPKGATIKRLQAETGARIDVDSHSVPCAIKISAPSEDAVTAARRAVEAILYPPSLELECNARHVPRLMGVQGATIKALQELSGARIAVEKVKLFNSDAPCENGTVRISISGMLEAMKDAESRVRALVFPLEATVACPQAVAGAMIGDHGEHIEALLAFCRRPLLADTGKGRGVSKAATKTADVLGAPFGAPFLNIDVVSGSVQGGNDVAVRVESNDRQMLARAVALVEAEVAFCAGQLDYLGPEGRALREQANECALVRGRCKDASQAAYERGEHEAARKLAAEGMAAAHRMEQLNIRARDAILMHRNRGRGLWLGTTHTHMMCVCVCVCVCVFLCVSVCVVVCFCVVSFIYTCLD